MLLKQAALVAQGKAPDAFFSYLAKSKELLASKSGASTVEQFLDPDHIQRALATRSVYYVLNLFKKLSQSKAPSLTK